MFRRPPERLASPLVPKIRCHFKVGCSVIRLMTNAPFLLASVDVLNNKVCFAGSVCLAVVFAGIVAKR